MTETENAADDLRRLDPARADRQRLIKAYLNRYKMAYDGIQKARARRREILLETEEARLYRPNEAGIRATSQRSTTERAAERRALADKRLHDAYEHARAEALAVIDFLALLPPFSEARAALEYVYIDRLTPERAAERMDKCRREIFRDLYEGVARLAEDPAAVRRVYEWRDDLTKGGQEHDGRKTPAR